MKARSALIAFLLLLFCFSFVKLTFAADIVINEFLPNPPSGSPEWVEFYNTTNSTVDLSDYYFDDDTNFDSDSGSSAKIALAGLLPSFQTCFWELSSYLNNNGDSPSIFKIGNTVIMDTYTYSSSSAGLSYSRMPDGGSWFALQTPTKSSSKCIDLAPTLIPTSAPANTPTNPPTSTTKPTVTPTVVTKAISKTPTPTAPTSSKDKDILGNATQSSNNSFEKSKEIKIENIQKSNNFLPIIFISIGVVFLLACAIVFLYPNIKNYLNRNNE